MRGQQGLAQVLALLPVRAQAGERRRRLAQA